MITEENFAKVLLAHKFTYNQEFNRYYKSFGTQNNHYEMVADFNSKKLELSAKLLVKNLKMPGKKLRKMEVSFLIIGHYSAQDIYAYIQVI